MMIKIGPKTIGENNETFIIAEAGVNHNGDLITALQLVDAAAEAGVDAIKFQTFKAEEVVLPQAEMAVYQKENTGKTETQMEMLQKLELKENFYGPIIDRCRQKGIIFLSTPHGNFKSADFLNSLDVPAFKIGSGDLSNLPLLEHVAKLKKPIILATGMSVMPEIKEAIDCVKAAGNEEIIVLHCTTNYPCPTNEVNLKAMQTIRDEFGVLVGYSDHTAGFLASIIAVALGARVVEKHFTLDKNLPGPDHKASTTPQELKEIIEKIREVEDILGSPVKKPVASELEMMLAIRKSVVALQDIKKGEIFTTANLGIKRPGTGLHPRLYFQIMGKTALQDIPKDTLIKDSDYE